MRNNEKEEEDRGETNGDLHTEGKYILLAEAVVVIPSPVSLRPIDRQRKERIMVLHKGSDGEQTDREGNQIREETGRQVKR